MKKVNISFLSFVFKQKSSSKVHQQENKNLYHIKPNSFAIKITLIVLILPDMHYVLMVQFFHLIKKTNEMGE